MKFYDMMCIELGKADFLPSGNKGGFPSEEMIKDSIFSGNLFVGRENGIIMAAYIMNNISDPAYKISRFFSCFTAPGDFKHFSTSTSNGYFSRFEKKKALLLCGAEALTSDWLNKTALCISAGFHAIASCRLSNSLCPFSEWINTRDNPPYRRPTPAQAVLHPNNLQA